MGRRSESKSHIRKLTRNGPYTFHITVPKREIDLLGWREKQKVTVTRHGKGRSGLSIVPPTSADALASAKGLLIRDWKVK